MRLHMLVGDSVYRYDLLINSVRAVTSSRQYFLSLVVLFSMVIVRIPPMERIGKQEGIQWQVL